MTILTLHFERDKNYLLSRIWEGRRGVHSKTNTKARMHHTCAYTNTCRIWTLMIVVVHDGTVIVQCLKIHLHTHTCSLHIRIPFQLPYCEYYIHTDKLPPPPHTHTHCIALTVAQTLQMVQAPLLLPCIAESSSPLEEAL